MGWDFTKGATKQDIIRECSQDWSNGGFVSRCLAKCVKGNCLWTVWEQTKPDGATVRYIMLYLLGCNKGYGWGYKDIAATSHPSYYTCPLSFLGMVPCTTPRERDGDAADWYDKVRAYHAKLAQVAEPGDTVALPDGRRFEVRETCQGQIKLVMGFADGKLYRFPRRLLAEATLTRRASETPAAQDFATP